MTNSITINANGFKSSLNEFKHTIYKIMLFNTNNSRTSSTTNTRTEPTPREPPQSIQNHRKKKQDQLYMVEDRIFVDDQI